MKKLALISLLAVIGLSAQAGGYRHHHHRHHHRHHGSSFSFSFGAYPRYWAPAYSYSHYPAYSYSYAYPSYSYDNAYSRPNYAVGGTLLGALAGGIIGHNVHRQGWEGAGIGAAAGLVLGSVAENNARARERAYSTPPVTYSSSYVPDAATINDAPSVPAAPTIPSAPAYRPASSMGGANALFGR